MPFLWTLFLSILLLLYVSWKNCFPILFLDMPCYPRDKLLIFVLIAFVNFQFSSVQFSRSVMSNSLQPHESQHARPPCPQTHVHRLGDAIQQTHRLSSTSPPAHNPSSVRVFSNETTLRMRWPKYWSFSFSICPYKEHPGPISFRL